MSIPPPPFTVKALYPYESDHPDDLNFQEGQIIEVTSVEDEEWFSGSYSDKSGMFPRNFVELVGKPAPVPVPSRPAKKAPIDSPVAEKPAVHIPIDKLNIQDNDEEDDEEDDDDWQETTTAEPLPVAKPSSVGKSSIVPNEPSIEHHTAEPIEKAAEESALDSQIDVQQTSLPIPHVSPSSAAAATTTTSTSPKATNAFKDRIAAFNSNAAPLVPKTVKDTSFVHKPYVSLPKSSYVPPSFPQSPPSKEAPKAPFSPNSDSADGHAKVEERQVTEDEKEVEEEEQEAQPKMSLKERIAMLQKEQEKMAAEAQAAVDRKKARAKAKKEAAANARSPQSKPLEPHQSGGSFSLQRTTTGESEIGSIISPLSTGHSEVPPIPDSHTTTIVEDPLEYEQQSQTAEEKEEYGDDEKDLHRGGQQEGEDEDEEDEDEDDDELDELDEEEAKRIALRERMARLAGGAGMNLGMIMNGGVMGMPMPVGGTKKKTTKPKKKLVEEESDESFVASGQVPMLPFADPAALAALQQKKLDRENESTPLAHVTDSDDHAAESHTNPAQDSIPVPAPVVGQSSENISSEEEDENDYGDTKHQSVRGPSSLSQVLTSSSQVPAHLQESGDADGEVTTQHEETSDDGYHTNSRPLSQASESLPARSAVPVLPPLDLPKSVDDIIDEELGDDEKTEPEETHVIPDSANKRRSYIRGSGVPPPIPTSPESSRFVSSDSRSHTMPSEGVSSPNAIKRASTYGVPAAAPPPPPVPITPHGAPPIPSHLAQTSDEDTGYEADIDTDRAPTDGVGTPIPTRSVPPPPPPSAPQLPPMDPPASNVEDYYRDDDGEQGESPVSVRSLKRTSTLPSARPPPPPPPPTAPVEIDSEDESFDDSHQSVPPVLIPTAPPTHAPPPPVPSAPAPPTHAPPPPVPSAPAPSAHAPHAPAAPAPPAPVPPALSASSSPNSDRTAVPISSQYSGDSRRSIDVGRSRKSIDRGGSDHPVNITNSARELSNLELETEWYLKPNAAPPSITKAAANGDVFYEVEDSTSTKRGGRTSVTRDVYVLYKDYSQMVITARYDGNDPAGTVSTEQSVGRAPELDKDLLEQEWIKYGKKVVAAANRGGNYPAGEFVLSVLRGIPGALPPIGRKVLGAIVYDNLSNATVKQLDEIRPGDAIAFKNARFQGHKGSLHQKYTQEAGRVDYIHLGIITEWDGTKLKVRVMEQTDNGRGKIKVESYRLNDLKSGEIRIFRVVGRDFVGWE